MRMLDPRRRRATDGVPPAPRAGAGAVAHDAQAASEAPTEQGSAGSRSSSPRWRRLLDAGLLDADFYARVTGEEFASAEQAARHYVRHGQPAGIPPTPLLDVACLPHAVRGAWGQGKVAPLLRHLRSDNGLTRSPSPLFEPPAPGSAEAEAAAAHPGGALGHFLAYADPAAPLPVRESFTGRPPSLAEAREALAAHARLVLWHDLTTRELSDEEWHQRQESVSRLAWDDAPVRGPEPRVSVVCDVGRHPERARTAVQALLAQDLPDWELVLVVAASATGAVRTCQALADDDARVSVVPVSLPGAAAAANAGVRAASAPLVACTADAAAWEPDYLRLAVTAIHGWGLAAAFGHARVRAGRPTRRTTPVAHCPDLGTLVVSKDLALAHPVQSTMLDWAHRVLPLAIPHALARCALPLAATHRQHPRGARRTRRPGTDTPPLPPTGAGLVDWEWTTAELDARVPGRISVITSTCDDFRTTVPAIRAALEHAGGRDVEAIVVDNGSRPEILLRLVAAFLGDPRVRVLRLPRTVRTAAAANLAASQTTGRTLVVLDHATLPHPGWLEPLVDRLEEPHVRGAQALLLNPDDTIASAGATFWAPDHLPAPFLAGHPPEDARAVHEAPFAAVAATALALDAGEFVGLRGFDASFGRGLDDVDLCLRAVQRSGGAFVVEPGSRVTRVVPDTDLESAAADSRTLFLERWRGRLPVEQADRYTALGMEIVRLQRDDSGLAATHPVVVRRRDRQDRHRLRWGIRIASTPGPLGNRWGDTHLAGSLSRALQQLGQDVVTYRRGAHAAAAGHLDDVVVAIRGLERTAPVPGKLNVLWVISHPERVGLDELREYDLVFAASRTWAARMTRLSGRPVQPLLQAVDSAKIPDRSVPLGDGSTPVFVGATHDDRTRQVVHDALASGLDVAVHGPGWHDEIPAASVRSEYVENRNITKLYREHGLVLADHWPDMAAEGFIANRIFDAVASGALVVSDEVPGLEMFDGVVQTYDSPQRLAYLCSPEGRAEFPAPDEVARVAERTSRHETFAARARQLVDAATGALRSETATSAVSVSADL